MPPPQQETAGKDLAQAKATFPALSASRPAAAALDALAAAMHDAPRWPDIDTCCAGCAHARQVVKRDR